MYSPFCCPLNDRTEIVFCQWLIFVQLIMSVKCFVYKCRFDLFHIENVIWRFSEGSSKMTHFEVRKLWKDACANPDTSQSTNVADHEGPFFKHFVYLFRWRQNKWQKWEMMLEPFSRRLSTKCLSETHVSSHSLECWRFRAKNYTKWR